MLVRHHDARGHTPSCSPEAEKSPPRGDFLSRTLLAAALVCAAGAAGAQTPAQPSRERAAAPPPTYRSAYEGYRPYADEPLAPWREVNEAVGHVGGHAGVLRAESGTTPSPPAAAGAAPAPSAKEQSHDAHHRK
jgi:hypothetical protein